MSDQPVKEITFEREYDAPIEKVWRAWTDAEQLKKWWGPDNVTIPECEVDLRVGGRMYIVMEADESMGELKGTRWPIEATFTAVEEPSKLAYTAKAWTTGDEEATTIQTTTDITFRAENGKTKIVLTAAIQAAGPRAGMAVEGMKYGYNQQFDKLGTFLTK